MDMNEAIVYPNNTVHFRGKFLKEWQCPDFLKKYRIPTTRFEESRKKYKGISFMLFSTIPDIGFNSDGKKKKKNCGRCGADLGERWRTGAKVCLDCGSAIQAELMEDRNRTERGHKKEGPRGLEQIMTNYNDMGDDNKSRTKVLDSWDWTGTSGAPTLRKTPKRLT